MIKKALKEHQKQKVLAPISLDVLGDPQLKVNGQPVRFTYLKAEALLYYLAATGRPHSRAALAALFWSKSDEKQARNSLRNAVYTIRRGLKPVNPLVVERDAIRLDMELIHLDLSQFQTTIEHPPDEANVLAKALALWRGLFLDSLYLPTTPAFEEWLGEQRVQYEALYRQGLFHLSQLYNAEKRLTDVQQTIKKLLAIDPLHEAGHQHRMRLYMQTGNRAATLRQYETLRALLIEELGVDPDPAIQALHLELLQADDAPFQQISPSNMPTKPIGRYQFVGREREMDLLSKIFQSTLPNGPAW